MREGVKPEVAEGRAWSQRLACVLDGASRWGLWLIALFVLVVIPWFFGGMGPEGYWFTVWAGRACLVPLSLWAVSSILIRRRPPAGFWVALVCWGLLAVQIRTSIWNPSHLAQAPWLGNGFDPVEHVRWRPSSAFWGSTMAMGRLWLSYGLFALTAYVVGLGRRQWQGLLWLFVINTGVLAALGIPFKYSGDYLMLGRWPMAESYFYSTFLYHNHWCAYALVGLAAAAGLFFGQRGLWIRLFLAVWMALIFASSLISVSRLGTLFMTGYLVLVLGYYLKQKAQARGLVWRRIFLFAGSALGALVLVGSSVIYLNQHGPGSVGQRTWSYIIRANPFASRFMLVEDAVPMLAAKPVFGWGLGAFGAGFRTYQRPESIVEYNEGRQTRYEHCHNDWMERLVELGFVGFALFVAPVVYWLFKAYGAKVLGLAPASPYLLLGLLALCFFALGDMAFDNRSVCAVSALFTGFLLRMRGLESGKA